MSNKSAYLFGTCLIDSFYPESGLDAISLIELCGYDVIFPQAQTCCGQPPYNSGQDLAARQVVQHTIETFPDTSRPLIVPSASCAGMIKHHYPRLFKQGSEQYAQAVELSKRTFELIEFLESRLPYEKQTDDSLARVSLHRSCSALREMQVSEQWLSILYRLKGVEVFLPEQETECCGFGGTFSIKSPNISAAMTEDKCKHLLSDKSHIILSGDCGCLLNIEGHLRKSHHPTPCMHVARFIAQRFGIRND